MNLHILSSPLHTHFLFLLLFLCSYLGSSSYQQICNLGDQTTLLSLSTTFVSSSPQLDWSSTTSCCKWDGVSCDASGRVTRLQLSSRAIKGEIGSSIQNLSSLTHLNLSSNLIFGSLPSGIVKLINLRILDLSSNNIFGSLPQEIGNLVYLEKLHLHSNNLSGTIPPSLIRCRNLIDLILRHNHLQGDISTLDFSRLLQLQKFDLLNNSFSGILPESLYSCKSLVAIRVADNNLSGHILPKIVELKSLSFLSISNNSFVNIKRTLESLSKLKNLTTLFLGWNFYGETLPSNKNFISSTGFPRLVYFSLDFCNLYGHFPNWLSNLKELRALNLNGNKITGKIPQFLGTLPHLISLQLAGNRLAGEIPKELCKLPALVSEIVDPNLNQFHFELPIFVLSHSTSDEFSSIPSTLVLAYNNLSGHIPMEIGTLQGLQQLLLQHNRFVGHIPNSLSNMKNLEYLDISENNITGKLPTWFEGLTFLSRFNVSFNDLQGPIPKGHQFDTFDGSSFEGNPNLCGELLDRPCFIRATQSPKPTKDQLLNGGSDSKKAFLDGGIVGFVSGFSVVLMIIKVFV